MKSFDYLLEKIIHLDGIEVKASEKLKFHGFVSVGPKYYEIGVKANEIKKFCAELFTDLQSINGVAVIEFCETRKKTITDLTAQFEPVNGLLESATQIIILSVAKDKVKILDDIIEMETA